MNWNLFFKKYEKKAFVIAYNYLRNKEDAFDVVQDAMLAMYKSYNEIQNEEEARLLFYKILNNKLTDKYRTIKRWLSVFSNEELPEIATEEDGYNFNEKEIKKVIKSLTAIQARIFLLKTIEGFTFKEMESLLSISESTCKTHYSRAIKKIKEYVN